MLQTCESVSTQNLVFAHGEGRDETNKIGCLSQQVTQIAIWLIVQFATMLSLQNKVSILSGHCWGHRWQILPPEGCCATSLTLIDFALQVCNIAIRAGVNQHLRSMLQIIPSASAVNSHHNFVPGFIIFPQNRMQLLKLGDQERGSLICPGLGVLYPTP